MEASTQKTWEIQRKEGKQLLEFLNSVAASRSDELKDRRSERQEQIRERLRALGWEDKYFCFYKESAKKQWDSLVEVSKPVTDRTWTNMLPKLTQLLEENRLHVDEFHRQRRRNGRVAEVRDFLRQPKRNMHPYQSIVDALQLERSPIQIGYMTLEVDPLLSNPFPEEQIIRGWDFLASIYSQENGLERVAGLLNERRDAICQKLLEWRTQVENQLVEQYKSSFAENVSLPTNAGTTLTVS
ncbi:hypothetical protein B0J17DRAFT_140047 [Rhizoctonia solani]|nr:hypothetical protein B0J17DRAFT_140047 [Rhizoctonia solani]